MPGCRPKLAILDASIAQVYAAAGHSGDQTTGALYRRADLMSFTEFHLLLVHARRARISRGASASAATPPRSSTSSARAAPAAQQPRDRLVVGVDTPPGACAPAP